MLYFEDFMEDIEDLPYEFKENLTAIRQLDLQVQNIMEPLDGRINDFFNKCNQNGLNFQQQQYEYDKIIKDFDEVESKNNEKIAVTEQMKDTFNKMIKKLDNELTKFKLELEADNPGSAESIERMVNQQLKSGVTESTQRVERKRIKRGKVNSDYPNLASGSRKIRSDSSTSNNYSFKADPIHAPSQNDTLMTSAITNGSISPASSFLGGSLNTPHSTKRKFDWKTTQSLATYDKSLKYERRRLKRISTTSDENSGTNEDLCLDDGDFITSNSVRKQSSVISDGAISETGSSRTPGSLNFGLSGSTCSSAFVGHGSSSTMHSNVDHFPPTNNSHHNQNPLSSSIGLNASSSNIHGLGNINSNVAGGNSALSSTSHPSTTLSASNHHQHLQNHSIDYLNHHEMSGINCTPNNYASSSSSAAMLPPLSINSTNNNALGNSTGCSLLGPASTSSGILSNRLQHQLRDDYDYDEEEDEEEEEPRYCYCNEISYGDMIACDAPNCPREWFHYGCVNLIVAPKGNWFCRECKQKIKQQSSSSSVSSSSHHSSHHHASSNIHSHHHHSHRR